MRFLRRVKENLEYINMRIDCTRFNVDFLWLHSQAYMDLLAFERKLDATIMRKRLDIQEALKRPQKIKRKLRIFISHTFFPGIVKRSIVKYLFFLVATH